MILPGFFYQTILTEGIGTLATHMLFAVWFLAWQLEVAINCR